VNSNGDPSKVDEATVSQTNIAVGKEPNSVEIADLNRDGRFDLVVANVGESSVTILLGDGKGKFTEANGSPFPAGHLPNDICIGDLNNDGKPDLAIANHEEKHLTVLLGDGKGAFAPAVNSPFTVGVRPHVHGVAAGDFNGDRNIDLVTDSWANDQILVLFGDGKATFKLPGTFLKVGKRPYQRHRVGDVNGDGNADIVTTNLEGNNVTVLLGNGKGGFEQPAGSPFASGDSPFDLTIGDVNGDGNEDLAVVNSPSSTAEGTGKDGLTVLLGNGKGGFTMLAASPFETGKTPNRVAIGDINGDGFADIAVSSPEGSNITLFLMSSKGVASHSKIPMSGGPKGLAIRDLNGDGKADIVVTNSNNNSVSILFGR
jgi:hypothetical protein